jgi:geranylgeranyl transferase type-2 subunit beta
MLDHLDWIDASGVMSFIIRCQDPEDGGIADAPGDMADVFHTFFGLAGMSLLGDRTLAEIDPRWALPIETLKRHFGASYVPPTYKSLPHHSTKNTSHQA